MYYFLLSRIRTTVSTDACEKNKNKKLPFTKEMVTLVLMRTCRKIGKKILRIFGLLHPPPSPPPIQKLNPTLYYSICFVKARSPLVKTGVKMQQIAAK